jgi:hypothetical protein
MRKRIVCNIMSWCGMRSGTRPNSLLIAGKTTHQPGRDATVPNPAGVLTVADGFALPKSAVRHTVVGRIVSRTWCSRNSGR